MLVAINITNPHPFRKTTYNSTPVATTQTEPATSPTVSAPISTGNFYMLKQKEWTSIPLRKPNLKRTKIKNNKKTRALSYHRLVCWDMPIHSLLHHNFANFIGHKLAVVAAAKVRLRSLRFRTFFGCLFASWLTGLPLHSSTFLIARISVCTNRHKFIYLFTSRLPPSPPPHHQLSDLWGRKCMKHFAVPCAPL